VLSILPHAAPEHPAPDTDQLTVFTAFAGWTDTENWYEVLGTICTVIGDTVTCCGETGDCVDGVDDCKAGPLFWQPVHPANAASAMTASKPVGELAIRSA
jgi:hypothetical protein